MNYIERNCCIEYEGKAFCANGAFVSPDYVIGYLGENGILADWHGNKLGTYNITSTWRIHGYLSSTMHQVYAIVDAITYTGRSCGKGMIFRGRKVK